MAARGEIPELTGVSSPSEVPERPELIARTNHESAQAAVARILEQLRENGIPGEHHAG